MERLLAVTSSEGMATSFGVLPPVSPEAGTASVEHLLRAVIAFVGPTPEDVVVAGERLNASHREALRAALNGQLSPMATSGGYLVPANAIVIDSVEVAGVEATVEVIEGPVPPNPRIACGKRTTIPLRRTSTWQVERDKAWMSCAFEGKRAASKREDDLREVFRLAMTEWHVGLDVRFVAGPDLSTMALRVLADVGPVSSATDIRTDGFHLPARSFFLSNLIVNDDDSAAVEAWRGPIPVGAILDCGTGSFLRLRRSGEGWVVAEHRIMMC